MSEENSHDDSRYTMLILFTMIFTILIIMGAYTYQNMACMGTFARFVPNASGNILLGMIVGGLLSLHKGMDEEFSFNEEFFFLVMLPPIIFASGFNLRKDFFFYNFGTILVYAFAGTAIATAVIAGLLNWLSEHVYKLDMNECLIFASLISAIDPVATIVTMQAAGVGGRLYALIFGEAVLNDAVAIVINGVFIGVAEEEKDIFAESAIAVPKILGITVASVLIGVLTALASALLYKKSQLRENHVLEVSLFFILGMIPYMICQSCNLSGIMAILFSGIFFDYYTYYHLSKEGKTAVKVIVHMLEFVFEGFIFFFLGTSLWSPNNKWEGGLFMLTLAACLIGRAVAVFPLSYLANLIGRKNKVTLRECIMMWFSGLRGPVSFALAFRISNKAIPNNDDRHAIITTTLLIIWVTSFLLGGSSDYVLRALGLTKVEQSGKSFMESRHWFRKLDSKYLKRFGVNTREFKVRHDDTNYAIGRPSHSVGRSSERSANPDLPTHFINLESPKDSTTTNINLTVPETSTGRKRGGQEGGNESISVVEMNEVPGVSFERSPSNSV